MNLDLPWLQNHVGTLTTEVAALRGEVISLRTELHSKDTELQSKDLVIADLKDQLKRLSTSGDDR